MSVDTLRVTLANLVQSGLVGNQISIVWHLGEPLIASLDFFRDSFAIIEEWASCGTQVKQSIQTNGTLLTESHIELFRRHSVSVGISIDGPALIHDSNRKTVGGGQSFDSTMRGLELLKSGGIDFNVITVLTLESLKYPDELYTFYVESGVSKVGFNIDEIEGANSSSSFERQGAIELFRDFFRKFYSLVRKEKRLDVREFRSLEHLIRSGRTIESNNQCKPYAIVNIGAKGDFSTFSPELLDLDGKYHGAFVLGNVHTDAIYRGSTDTVFNRINSEVASGVKKCAEECDHFCICGGGAPSNKLFENGTIDSTETLSCRLTVKTLSDVIMECMEYDTRAIQ